MAPEITEAVNDLSTRGIKFLVAGMRAYQRDEFEMVGEDNVMADLFTDLAIFSKIVRGLGQLEGWERDTLVKQLSQTVVMRSEQ